MAAARLLNDATVRLPRRTHREIKLALDNISSVPLLFPVRSLAASDSPPAALASCGC
jgi:hypothetical protein